MDAGTQTRLVCTGCARGCLLLASADKTGTIRVEGNACPQGETFALLETNDPRRTLTTSVATGFTAQPRLAVRLVDVPKSRVLDAMKAIDDLCVREPIAAGTVISDDFLGIGLRVVALEGIGR